jgi:hypothetical protein
VDLAPFRQPFDVQSTSTDSEASPEEEHIWGQRVTRTTQNHSMNAQSYDTVSIAKSGHDLAQICIHTSYRPGSDSTTPSSSSPFTPFSQTLVNSSPEEDEMEEEDVTPKLEELEDELADIKPTDEEIAVDTDPLSALANGNIPRKRGRPRKHPIPPVTGAGARVAKGRSKTGCITCRRRKKKCDETKPACQNCQKNAVVCEGYPLKEIWKSGRQKATEAGRPILLPLQISELTQSVASRRQSLVELPPNLPFLIDGIETDTDRRFLDHFATNFSRVLTMVNDDTNPFKEILLPMATQNRGLMHSLMCLSGSHLSSKIPDNEIIQRKHWHFNHALSDLRQSLPVDPKTGAHRFDQVDDSTIASTVALCLRTICDGETNGEYRTHMNAARVLLDHTPTNDSAFRNFITEFLRYHEVSSRITNIPPTGSDPSSLRLPDFVPPIHAGTLLGVFDGLFRYISQITDLRDKIRRRLDSGIEPAVDYNCLAEAVQIDSHIREWKPSQIPQSTDWLAAQLYRQSTWVYLYRTIQPSKSSPKISGVVDDGLEYLNQLPKDSGPQSIMLMPLFLLGCAAFEPQQREVVKGGFETLREYSGLGNIRHARSIVEKVWERMDWRVEESWDWERIIGEMGYDFLVT